MSFPSDAKNRDFFSAGKDVYKYNEKYKVWSKIVDVNQTINLISDYSKYIKENPYKESYIIPVENGLADVSFLHISTTTRGKPNDRQAYMFVYDENSETNNIPIMSYVKGNNNGITIIDGNLQVSNPDITEVRVFYDDSHKEGAGFFASFEDNGELEGQIILSIYSQNDKYLNAYIEAGNIIVTVDNIRITRQLKQKNFIYINIKDYKDFDIYINGIYSGIENSFDLFYPINYDFDYELTSDFDITFDYHNNYPYHLYINKDLSFINYTNEFINSFSTQKPQEIKLVSGEINLDNYVDDIYPGSIINVYFVDGGTVQYTYDINEFTEDVIKQNTRVSYIWNGEAWRALSAYPVGSIYLTILDDNPQGLFGGSWIKQEDIYENINTWLRVI